MTSYSQYGEDLEVLKLLGNITGRLLDIGAWHPRVMSNSRLLIEKGWDALLCEFSPGLVRTLAEEYGKPEYSNRVQVLQAAVSTNDNGILRRFDVTDDGVSTSEAAILEKWRAQGGYFGPLWVPQLSLERLLCQFGGGFQFVSIDSEGTSVDLAIQYICELEQEPMVMCVEHDDRLAELMGKVQSRGYRIAHLNGTNAILERAL